MSQLAEATRFYDELLERSHVATAEHLGRATERHRIYFEGRPHCTLLRPHLVDAATEERVRRAAACVNKAIVQAATRVLGDAALAKAAGIPEYFEPILAADRGHARPPVLARLDGVVDASGSIRFIEYNTDPGAVAENAMVEETFASMPIARAFAERFPFETTPTMEVFFDALSGANAREGKRGPPAIAEVRGPSFEPRRELAYAAWRGCPLVSPRLEEMRFQGGALHVEDLRIDLVAIDWPQLLEAFFGNVPAAAPLVEALRAGSVALLNGLSLGLLCGAKVLFALLSDPAHAHLFDADVAAALPAHVPWTRRVHASKTTFEGRTIDLMPFIQQNRERLVIKPSGSAGGEGVVLGWEIDDAGWQKALRRAVTRPHVVQERVAIGKQSFPLVVDGRLEQTERFVDFNPYVWNGETVRGEFIRVAPGSVLNQHAGGGEIVPNWVLRAT